MHTDPGVWLDLAGKVGPPIFAGTLVAWLVSNQFTIAHGTLMAIGLVLIGIHHRRTYHRR